jgi:hypothetical protein
MRNHLPSISIVAIAVGEAEDALEGLPLTPAVRQLQTRTAAFKTVLGGLMRGIPKLAREQHARLVEDTVRLADEVEALVRELRLRAKAEAG